MYLFVLGWLSRGRLEIISAKSEEHPFLSQFGFGKLCAKPFAWHKTLCKVFLLWRAKTLFFSTRAILLCFSLSVWCGVFQLWYILLCLPGWSHCVNLMHWNLDFAFSSYTPSVISKIVVLEQTIIFCLAQAFVINNNCYFDSSATFNKVFYMKLFAFFQLNLCPLF